MTTLLRQLWSDCIRGFEVIGAVVVAAYREHRRRKALREEG